MLSNTALMDFWKFCERVLPQNEEYIETVRRRPHYEAKGQPGMRIQHEIEIPASCADCAEQIAIAIGMALASIDGKCLSLACQFPAGRFPLSLAPRRSGFSREFRRADGRGVFCC